MLANFWSLFCQSSGYAACMLANFWSLFCQSSEYAAHMLANAVWDEQSASSWQLSGALTLSQPVAESTGSVLCVANLHAQLVSRQR